MDKLSNNQSGFYQRFKEELNKNHKFPGDYVFKFILPNNIKNIGILQKIFDHANPSIFTKESRNKNYISITVSIYSTDATSIIEYYKEASKIENIIML